MRFCITPIGAAKADSDGRRNTLTTEVAMTAHRSAERVVSGSGLENLYGAVVALDGADAPQRDAAEITTAALNGEPIAARQSS